MTFRHPTITKGNANMHNQMVVSIYVIQSATSFLSVRIELMSDMDIDGSGETYFMIVAQDASSNISTFMLDDLAELQIGCFNLRRNFIDAGEVEVDFLIDLVEGLEDASDE